MKSWSQRFLAIAILCLGPGGPVATAEGRRNGEAQADLPSALTQSQDAQTRVASWEALGESAQYANEMARAEASFRTALEIGEAAWGESLQVAGTLARLGNVLRLQNRLDEAAEIQERAWKIRKRWAPDSLEVADSLHQLFLVAWDRRDLEATSDYNRRALAILERWPADSLAMADSLNDLALLADDQGRHDDAAAALERALSILERKAPDSLPLATSLARLGWVATELGDEISAEDLLRRALAIRETLAPASLGTAAILSNLGVIARERGDATAAAELFRRSLRVWEKTAPDGRGAASVLDSLGIVAQMRGDLDEAWSFHRRALEIFERQPSGSQGVAFTLGLLGRVAEARGDLSLALDLQQQAYAICKQQEDAGIYRAVTLQQLGRVHGRMGHPVRAAQLLSRAVDALELEMGKLGGAQKLQPTFQARYEDVYLDAIAAELELGQAAEAFHLTERSRARSFLKLLTDRNLTLPGGQSAALQPKPFDLDEARQVLDPGTLALSYSVGQDRTFLFAVTREGGLRVKILNVGEERLRQDVKDFLEGIQAQEAPVDLARSLYRTLIGPVSDLAERSRRILILPDGPLHRLPFGALVRDTGRGQYLVEWKPLHFALSLTVYGTLRAPRISPSSAATTFVAFGDPWYPRRLASNGNRDPALRPSAGLRSFDWTPLPYSRREVERSAQAYPGARLYLGEEATEERVKAVARDARVLHLATHGYFDDRAPLDSALVLSIPEEQASGGDDGLLRVREIFESVRIDADLVVLSACESALGRELRGEGLIGLTRAFQFAGARSVVASLWSVSDQATAELMVRFHHHHAAGLSKDEALRQAQIELLHQPIQITTANGQTIEMHTSAPFFWADFQVFGDWQ